MTRSVGICCIIALCLIPLHGAVATGQKTAPGVRPTSTSSTSTGNAQDHLSRGILLASRNHYKAAQFELEQANALQPGDFAILFNLGQVELRNGDTLHANLDLARALKLKPQSPETLYLMAQVFANQSRSLDALDLLARARSLAPSNVDILYLMAQIGISQRYYEDAVPLLEQAAHLAPGRTDIAMSLGEAYFKSDQIGKAIDAFTRLLQSHPSVAAYGYLGVAYTYTGRFDEARQNLQHALRLEPTNKFCLFQLGYLAKLQGDSVAAERLFNRVLRSDPNQSNSLLALATIRMEQKRYTEAVELLNRYIRLSDAPATGYYKLAIAEKNLHEDAASQRDFALFQESSKGASSIAHPYDHLFDYIDERSRLDPDKRLQQDLSSLEEQAKLHPDQHEVLYCLAEAELKIGQIEQARATIASLNKQRPDDGRTLTSLGVLLARYGFYGDAISEFQAALQTTPESDDANFDLANAYLHQGTYSEALSAALKVSAKGRKDDSYSALLADIYAHTGDTANAEALFQSVIERSPDKDQNYLSLALLQLRENRIPAAVSTMTRGKGRVPGSGKLAWGLGLAALLEGDIPAATTSLEQAVELLPEWPGSYATLGFFYYQTGQIDKAKEVLDRFKNSGVRGGLDVNRIAQTLADAPAVSQAAGGTLSMAQRVQVFQLALYLADKTL